MAVDMKTVSLNEWNELQTELRTLRADKLSYDSIADGLSTELQSLRQQLDDKETHCQSYSDSNAAIRSNLSTLNTKYEKVMIEKSEALSTITELKATLCNLQNDNKNYKKQNHRLQVQNDEFTEEVHYAHSLHPCTKLFAYSTAQRQQQQIVFIPAALQ